MKKTLLLLGGLLLSQTAAMAGDQWGAQPAPERLLPASAEISLDPSEADGPHLLTEVPEGEMKYYAKQSAGYMLEWTSFVEYVSDNGVRIVFTEDGDVYFENFLSKCLSDGWIKGTLSDDKTSIRVDFPQDYYVMDGTEYWGTLYRGEVTDPEALECTIDVDNNYVTFRVDESGAIELDEGQGIVMVYNDGYFSGFADTFQDYVPAQSPGSIPEDVQTEEWAFIFDSGNGTFVDFGEKDGKAYIKGFAGMWPETAIIGEVNGDRIDIATGQFLGLYEGQMIYLEFAELDMTGGLQLFEEGEKFTFLYDRVAHTLTPSTEGLIWACCPVQEEDLPYVNYVTTLYNPSMKYQGEAKPAPPVAPELSWYDDSQYEEIGESYLWFSLPPFNVNGDLIRTDNYYYVIYVDDDPYVFLGDFYPVLGEMGIAELTDMPFSLELGGGLAVMGPFHGVVLLCGGMDKIDVRSYVLADGEKLWSDKMTVDLSGVDSVVTGNEIVASEFYDMAGVRTTASAKGFKIRKDTLSDGSLRVTKVIR